MTYLHTRPRPEFRRDMVQLRIDPTYVHMGYARCLYRSSRRLGFSIHQARWHAICAINAIASMTTHDSI